MLFIVVLTQNRAPQTVKSINMWVVVKIMVPFVVHYILRHLYLGDPKRDHHLITTHVEYVNLTQDLEDHTVSASSAL